MYKSREHDPGGAAKDASGVRANGILHATLSFSPVMVAASPF